MRLQTKMLIAVAASFLFAGGVTTVAHAVASSAETHIGVSSAGGCARGTAWTYNNSSQNGQLVVKGYAAGIPQCAGVTTHAKPSGNLGASAYLKRASDGSICSSVGVYYNPSSTVSHQRIAWKGGCPAGQLAGGGTGYVYNGSGYSSANIQAPYQTF